LVESVFYEKWNVFLLASKTFNVYTAIFENAKIVLFAATKNGVSICFIYVYSHVELMLSESGDFFYLLLCRVFEEEAVGVTVKNLDVYLPAMIKDLGDAMPADGGCGFSNGWAIEVEAFCPKDAIAGIQDYFKCALCNVVPTPLFMRQGFVLCARLVPRDPKVP